MPRGLGKKTLALREQIIDVINHPRFKDVEHWSSRQIAYALVGEPWQAIENNEREKTKVLRVVLDMRRDGTLPYSLIVDRTRKRKFVSSWETVEEYIDPDGYRQDLWIDQPVIPIIVSEKQALEGIIEEVCEEYGLSPWIIRGFNSESTDYDLSEEIKEITTAGKKVVVGYLGDWDPSGLCIEEVSRARTGDGHRVYGFKQGKDKIKPFGAKFEWVRLGLNLDDFDRFDIATVPVKKVKYGDDGRLESGDPRSNSFFGEIWSEGRRTGRAAARGVAAAHPRLHRAVRRPAQASTGQEPGAGRARRAAHDQGQRRCRVRGRVRRHRGGRGYRGRRGVDLAKKKNEGSTRRQRRVQSSHIGSNGKRKARPRQQRDRA